MKRINRVFQIGVLLLSACSSPKVELPADIEIVPIDVHVKPSDPYSFIEKMEILPLETNDSSLMNASRKVIYDREMDLYAVFSKDQVAYTFDGEGRFVGSSEKMRGQGPEEYFMAVDMNFNLYTKGIDLLNPYGIVCSYTPSFDFISRKTIEPKFFFNGLMPLSADEYVFTIPAIWVNQEVAFVDFSEKETQMVSYEGTISSNNTMDKSCFYKVGENFYYVPQGINYFFYEIDLVEKDLHPVIYLDFGEDEISDDLPGTGVGGVVDEKVSSNQKMDVLIKEMEERAQYIREHGFIIPLVKFFNDDYIYVLFAEGENLGGHYIYDRKRRKSYLLKGFSSFYMQPCFGIVDNVLLAICNPWHIHELIDEKLLSEDEMRKINSLREDDNPVIIKYYLCDK